jgi:hypothetical protein
MRFMMMLKGTAKTEAGGTPDRDVMIRMGRLMEDMARAGVLLAADGLKPSSEGKRLRFRGGKITSMIDGPFTETKELVAGFCMIETASWDEALEWARRFAAVEGDGETEIRPLYEVTDFPPEVFPPEEVARELALRDELNRKAASR